MKPQPITTLMDLRRFVAAAIRAGVPRNAPVYINGANGDGDLTTPTACVYVEQPGHPAFVTLEDRK